MDIENLAGGIWLKVKYGIDLVMPLSVHSSIGGQRKTHEEATLRTETYVRSMRPEHSLRGHLTFHLKHEVLHLELLVRLFAVVKADELVAWIEAEPTGQYARRAGFLYEWLTGKILPVRAGVGAYVDAIDARTCVAASAQLSVDNPRWRVRDNLPGTAAFCPIIRKTPASSASMALDIASLILALNQEFGEDLLLRSSVWMTLGESKASFAIEGEANQADRITRFANVLALRTGEGGVPLDAQSLEQLQGSILGARHSLKKLGIRESPVFVGQSIHFQNIVNYIAPPAKDVSAMLDGLSVFLQRTKGQSAVMRSAVAAFGFVYIHPLADGNGRVHRFLVNDILRRDGVIESPMIVPVSSFINRDSAQRSAYAQILESISKPLMAHLDGQYEFSDSETIFPDGIASNFVFSGEILAQPVWRYMDLTAHVEYLANALERTIQENMRKEAQEKRSYDQARAAIKNIVEMPNDQIDRVIRSMNDNKGQLSNALAKEIPILLEQQNWEAITKAIRMAFQAPSLDAAKSQTPFSPTGLGE